MENYYGELTKAYGLARQLKKEKLVQSIYIDVLIQESILKEEERKLKLKIDQAIDQKDRASFHKLAEQLKLVAEKLYA